ncbi:MAG: metal-dependent hydrolase [Anaerolineae bacterium]|nr:metal-dependent hydrolase [Anaerolineae bacterium]
MQHRLLDTDLGLTMSGALFPDALDKTLCQVLRLTPSGRMWGHTTLSVGTTTLLVALMGGSRAARSWLLGYLGHLLADLEGPIPWWYPFRTYEFDPSPGFAEIFQRFTEDKSEVLFEISLLGLGLLALGIGRKA